MDRLLSIELLRIVVGMGGQWHRCYMHEYSIIIIIWIREVYSCFLNLVVVGDLWFFSHPGFSALAYIICTLFFLLNLPLISHLAIAIYLILSLYHNTNIDNRNIDNIYYGSIILSMDKNHSTTY